MKEPLTEQYVLNKLREWTSNEKFTPSLLISQDDASFHLGFYQGMGNSDSTPIERLDPLYKEIINQLYQEGELQASGKAYKFYPGSDFFNKLVFSS